MPSQIPGIIRTTKNKDNDIKIEPVFNGKDICIEADKNRINQVISNLLTNAIKFTKQGTITILTETKEGNGAGLDGRKGVIVAVRDSGIGIDLGILPKLFTKFTSELGRRNGIGSIYIKEYHRSSWRQNLG